MKGLSDKALRRVADFQGFMEKRAQEGGYQDLDMLLDMWNNGDKQDRLDVRDEIMNSPDRDSLTRSFYHRLSPVDQVVFNNWFPDWRENDPNWRETSRRRAQAGITYAESEMSKLSDDDILRVKVSDDSGNSTKWMSLDNEVMEAIQRKLSGDLPYVKPEWEESYYGPYGDEENFE